MRTAGAINEVEITGRADFTALPVDQLEAMAAAGQEIVEIHRILAKTGDNIVGELIRGHPTFFEWDHYPTGDVYDHETHGQYYYHAHPPEQRFPGEHGHFHTFVRPKGMPPGIKPAPIPGAPKSKDPNGALCHLVAIAMDGQGFPLRLFTVNRWVTGETWYIADDVSVLLDYFKIDHARPSWPVNRWVTAMIQLYKPEIRELLTLRDQTVQSWAEKNSSGDVFEDRNLEVTSYVDVSIDKQVQRVAKTLLAAR